MKIKKGDNVVVIAGKNRNKTGKILKTLTKTNRVVVEGVNLVKRHVKKTKTQKGRIAEFEASMDASNVMLLDPKTSKPTRVGYTKDDQGRKQRIAKKSKTIL